MDKPNTQDITKQVVDSLSLRGYELVELKVNEVPLYLDQNTGRDVVTVWRFTATAKRLKTGRVEECYGEYIAGRNDIYIESKHYDM